MIRILLLLLAITFLLSVFNWYEEGCFQGFLFSSVGSVFGGAIATFVLAYISSRKRLPELPFKVSAVISVALSLAVYTSYAFNGKAENSSESAAQMHVIVFPILHTLLTIALLLLACLTAFVYNRLRRRNA